MQCTTSSWTKSFKRQRTPEACKENSFLLYSRAVRFLPAAPPQFYRESPMRFFTLLLIFFVAASVHSYPIATWPAPGSADRPENVLKTPPPGEKGNALCHELQEAIDALLTLPPAVTILGGSRIRAVDPLYELARDMGRRLASAGIPPCTGGGEGIMEAAPRGYLEAIARSDDRPRTQAFSFHLPREQKVNPFIEVSLQFSYLAVRKFALFENKRGFCVFPGGFGTFDELFELWDLRARGELGHPLVPMGSSFWTSHFSALREVAVQRRLLITPEEMSLCTDALTDEPAVALKEIAGKKGIRGFELDPAAIESLLAGDIRHAASFYAGVPRGVVFLGSSRLEPDDPAVIAAREISGLCGKRGFPVHLVFGGPSSCRIASSVQAGNGRIDGFFLKDDKIPAPGLDRSCMVRSSMVHKMFIEEKMSALIVLPCDLKGLSEFFGVLCQMQNGLIEKRPVILLGKKFWKPLLGVMKDTMLSPERELISPGDLDLMAVTDGVQEAMRFIEADHDLKRD